MFCFLARFLFLRLCRKSSSCAARRIGVWENLDSRIKKTFCVRNTCNTVRNSSATLPPPHCPFQTPLPHRSLQTPPPHRSLQTLNLHTLPSDTSTQIRVSMSFLPYTRHQHLSFQTPTSTPSFLDPRATTMPSCCRGSVCRVSRCRRQRGRQRGAALATVSCKVRNYTAPGKNYILL